MSQISSTQAYNNYMTKSYPQNDQKCVCGGLNNGQQPGEMAMPQKFGPADGTQSFASNRNAYINKVYKNYNRSERTPQLSCKSIGIDEKYTKKRGGFPLNNNSSSSVTEMRRVKAVGQSSTTPPKNENMISLGSASNVKTQTLNTINSARRRCRSSGYVVPPKVYSRRSDCS